MAVAVAASSAAVPAAGTEGNAWPFAILRIYGNGESNDGFLRQDEAAGMDGMDSPEDGRARRG